MTRFAVIILLVGQLVLGIGAAGRIHAQDRSSDSLSQPARASSVVSAYEEAKKKVNDNVVTIAASGRTTVYTQLAEEISNVIESRPDRDLRVLTMLGKGAEDVLADMLYLKGMDMGFVEQDILERLSKKDPLTYANLPKRINYITKITSIVLQIYAKKDIKSLEDLRGKKISCLKVGSSTSQLCRGAFRALNIDVEIVGDDAELAMQKVKSGEIAAAARGGPPPVGGFEKIRPEDGLHLVPISENTLPTHDFNAMRLQYLPYRLKHETYPNLIPPGQEVETVATGAVLAVYAWPPGTKRYENVAKFVDLFFSSIDELQKKPRHPAWQEINLAANLPGWTRFPAAQEWLDARRQAASITETAASSAPGDNAKLRVAFQKFLDDVNRGSAKGPMGEEQKQYLFDQFLQWWDVQR